MIGKTVGHYRITARLGAGGMGEVFLAEDTRLDRKAAIKFLPADLADDPDRRQRFLTEAKAASALNHPHVCVVYDVGETEDGLPFIAMEFVEGQSLSDLVKQGSPEISSVVAIAVQVADALDAAHSRRIVHRDIKPENISLNERGEVKVLDFGLAKRMLQESDDSLGTTLAEQQTQEGHVLGTPRYMSPEQAVGKAVDHRSDLFSLGSVIYFLLTGRPPFAGANLGEVLDNVVHKQPEAIARFNYDVPPELERITLKLLAKQARPAISVGPRSAGGPQEPVARPRSPAERPLDRGGPGRTPKEIAESDIVITYANLDDRPVVSGRQGWVSQFEQNLQLRVAQLSGKQVAVVKQPDTSDSADIESAILEQMPRAKTVVSVLSPPFARSNGCRRIVDTFWRSAQASGRFEIGNRSRLLNVIKSPVDADDLPPDLRTAVHRSGSL